jgi:hypothetical protein
MPSTIITLSNSAKNLFVFIVFLPSFFDSVDTILLVFYYIKREFGTPHRGENVKIRDEKRVKR